MIAVWLEVPIYMFNFINHSHFIPVRGCVGWDPNALLCLGKTIMLKSLGGGGGNDNGSGSSGSGGGSDDSGGGGNDNEGGGYDGVVVEEMLMVEVLAMAEVTQVVVSLIGACIDNVRSWRQC